MLGYLTFVVGGSLLILKDTPRNTYAPEVNTFIIFFIVSSGLLVILSKLKGPKPKWRWGKKDSDNPEEDW